MNKRKIVFLLVFFILSGSDLKSQADFSETTGTCIYNGMNISVLINKSPFQLVIRNYETDVIKINGIIRGGKASESNEKVVSCESGQNRIGLLVSAASNDFYTVKILIKENSLKISLRPSASFSTVFVTGERMTPTWYASFPPCLQLALISQP